MDDKTAMVVRPASGSRRLRKNASLRLEGGAIVATDRRGRSRRFPIDGSDESPRGFRSAQQLDSGGYYLEDRRGRALVRLRIMDWDPEKVHALDEPAGFEPVIDPKRPSDRPEMMKIEDPPYFARASTSAAVGIAAVSMYWLHIAPEAVMLLVALPALILFLWFITLTKLAMPKREDLEAAARRVHEARLRLDAESPQAPEATALQNEGETDRP
ncbi:MAG TPA: hypothetical protein VHL53_14480 [Acidimicrobiia bacterium]|nr:hypothetical protein [Acidimicrobiia bacterium]